VDLIKFLAEHGELVFTVCQVMVAGVMLYLSTKFASKKDAADARELARTAHDRLNLLDERLKGFPDYDVVNELKEDIGQIKETQSGTNTELRLLRGQLERMDDFLRSKP
jgi:hypothetical protein